MTSRTLYFAWIALLSFSAQSQQYATLSVDNDLYFGIDRYYSSGLFLKYGKLKKKPKDSLDSSQYVSQHWTLGQEINTPSFRFTSDLSRMDYPYNGWLFLGFQKEYFKHLDFGYGWGVQLGTTGANESLAKFFQNTYHIYVLKLEPLTWAYSIPQAVHFNVEIASFLGKEVKGRLKWVQENRAALGTFRTQLSTRFGLQWGTLPGLPFFGQRLEDLTDGVAFFLGTQLTFNISDYSLSGSLFRSNSPFDFELERFRGMLQGGIMLYRSNWRTKLIYNYSSALITTQRIKYHPYLNISLSRVF